MWEQVVWTVAHLVPTAFQGLQHSSTPVPRDVAFWVTVFWNTVTQLQNKGGNVTTLISLVVVNLEAQNGQGILELPQSFPGPTHFLSTD